MVDRDRSMKTKQDLIDLLYLLQNVLQDGDEDGEDSSHSMLFVTCNQNKMIKYLCENIRELISANHAMETKGIGEKNETT